MSSIRYYNANQEKSKHIFNLSDFAALALIIAILFVIAWGTKQMTTPYQIGEQLPISLSPNALPNYAIRSILRMVIALCFSLIFTFTVGTWAAKSKTAERFLIPMLDILQSIPVLSFLSITVVGFIALFPGSLLGPEFAAIFAIFTAQAWNMTFSFYQSLKTIPKDMSEAAQMFHLSAWEKFWRVEVPFASSGLLWNTMMSMSASWFYVVASEAISVSNQTIRLPGIGSYIFTAIKQANISAVMYAILTMLIVILIYDQFVFRPLLQWSEKFKFDQKADDKITRAWLFNLLQRSRLMGFIVKILNLIHDEIIFLPRKISVLTHHKPHVKKHRLHIPSWINYLAYLIPLVLLVWFLSSFIAKSLPLTEVSHVAYLGMITFIRVMVLIFLSSLLWVPVGVWIGKRDYLAYRIQPIVQFAAAFPAYLLFPLVVIGIVKFHLNPEIWTSPLMILGSQWYILFNVIAGVLAIPQEWHQLSDNLGLKGFYWWKRLALPGIFPYYITGVVTAAGGAWNASIVAEVVSWGNKTIYSTGLGAYITTYTAQGDFPRIALGTSMMCLWVLFVNRIVWRPLYQLAEKQYHSEM